MIFIHNIHLYSKSQGFTVHKLRYLAILSIILKFIKNSGNANLSFDSFIFDLFKG